ncbi:MAG: transposase [Geminicoccaceae bacterium]
MASRTPANHGGERLAGASGRDRSGRQSGHRQSLETLDNVTLISLPPYSPELNPVERLWLYLRERFLSLRVFEDQDAIIDACCHAWNAIADDADRIKSLSCQPWIKKVISK